MCSWESEGVLLGSVENLSATLPKESCEHFGDILLDYIKELVTRFNFRCVRIDFLIVRQAFSNGTLPFEQQRDISDTLRNAVIATNGELTPNFKYIAKIRAEREKTQFVSMQWHVHTQNYNHRRQSAADKEGAAAGIWHGDAAVC